MKPIATVAGSIPALPTTLFNHLKSNTMTLIRKPNEIQIQGKIKMLIYGQPGMGKTTMALSAPDPLLIDCDNGVQRVNPAHISDTVQVSSYNDVLAVLNEDLSPYKSLVIDTAGKLLDFIAAYVINRNPKLGRANGAPTLQGYGEIKAEFSQFCKLVMSKDKHLIFVAHRQTRTEGDETRYVPLFSGSNYDAVVTELDLLGYIEANGNKRTITFNGTSRNDGKNTCNLPAMLDIPCVVDPATGNGLPNRFLSDAVIKAYNNHLSRLQEQGHKYAAIMSQLKENIAAITDDISANDFIDRIDTFDHVGASKVAAGQLLSEKCRALKLTFNKTTRRYEQGA